MYSMVLVVAMASPADSAGFGHRKKAEAPAAGCVGTACYGTACYGSSCHGTVVYSSGCYGSSCHGTVVYGSCYGSTAKATCYGTTTKGSCYGHAPAGCYGSAYHVVGTGCYGTVSGGCYGSYSSYHGGTVMYSNLPAGTIISERVITGSVEMKTMPAVKAGGTVVETKKEPEKKPE